MRTRSEERALRGEDEDRENKVRRASVEGREDEDREDKVIRASVEEREDEDCDDKVRRGGHKSEC